MKPAKQKPRRIHVHFMRRPPMQSNLPERRYGGCGVLTVPPLPYTGPSTMEFEVAVGSRLRRFQAVRLRRSPTGHAFGSFRIDELTADRKGNPKEVTLGYNCSWPDADVCARLARERDHQQ
jgi:hypothetical protein